VAFELGRDGPNVIMAGFDGSPTAWHAVAYAAGLARRQGSRLLVVYAVGLPAVAAAWAPSAGVAIEQSLDEGAAELRRELEAQRGWHALDAEFRVERGEAFAALCRVADAERADAVIVGASAQAGHRLVGSLAVRLVRSGKWPVTVVP
jgi:nucleotide-binding universal stress UspA family protein